MIFILTFWIALLSAVINPNPLNTTNPDSSFPILKASSQTARAISVTEKIEEEKESREKIRENLHQTSLESEKKSGTRLEVPFYSQLKDISDPKWQKLGCGVTSLAMIIEYFEPGSISSIDTILKEGINAGAYLNGAGWIHQGLVDLSKQYGFNGQPFDLSGQNMDSSFAHISKSLEDGPVIASVYYTFDPKNPIPHLVVLNSVSDGKVYYNDPAEKSGGNTLSISEFKRGWKKRYITIRPQI